jgi:hypothetical protein
MGRTFADGECAGQRVIFIGLLLNRVELPALWRAESLTGNARCEKLLHFPFW